MTLSFYVDDGVFIFLSRDNLKSFYVFPLCRTPNATSKTEAMYFPPRLLDTYASPKLPANIHFNNGENHVQFTDKLKYLGVIITPALKEDLKIQESIKKSKAQMGALRPFFMTRDVYAEGS